MGPGTWKLGPGTWKPGHSAHGTWRLAPSDSVCTCYICTELALGICIAIGFLDYARASYNLNPICID